MNKPSDVSTEFEQEVRLALAVPDADAGYLSALREQVMRKKLAVEPKPQGWLSGWRPVWAISVAVIALVLVVTLFVGPQRVLAQLQGILGYVPGVGFVNKESALALREPIAQVKNGQTFQVDQILASPKETVLVARLEGFPAYQNVGLNQGVSLQLPDGKILTPGDFSVENTGVPGEYLGVFKMSPLPKGVNRVTVTWKQTNLTSQPVNWQVTAVLYPVTDPDIQKSLPNSYAPVNASVTQHDITLKVDQVSSSPQGTGVRLQMIFSEAFSAINPNDPVLFDNLGKTYPRANGRIPFEDQGQSPHTLVTQDPTPRTFTSLHQNFEFPAVDPAAQRLGVRVTQMGFSARPYAAYSIDMGVHPAVGDQWPINQVLTISDLSFKVLRARLISLDQNAFGNNDNAIGQSMVGLVLDIEPANPDVAHLDQVWLYVPGSREVFDKATNTWSAAWTPDKAPAGKIDIHLTGIQGVIQGNWQIRWDHQKPASAGAASTPVTQRSSPMLDSNPVNGVVLRLLNVSQTANATALKVQLRSETPNTLVFASCTDGFYLLDAQGHFIPFTGDVLYGPDGPDKLTLTTRKIASGQPMTLVMKGSLEVTRQLSLPERPPSFSIDLGEQPEIGQSWDLDETFSFDGKTIHLNGARLLPGFLGGTAQLAFQMDPVDQVLGARISLAEKQSSIESGYGRMQVNFYEMPHGVLTFQVIAVDDQVDGTWKINWTAP